jgi:hypothetical protein
MTSVIRMASQLRLLDDISITIQMDIINLCDILSSVFLAKSLPAIMN